MKCETLISKQGKIIYGPIVISPDIFNDDRGYFFESWNQSKFNKLLNENVSFKQDNQSFSKIGVLRGLHYQLPPFAQGKLVRCIEGTIFDVAVDLRKDSETFKLWVATKLDSLHNRQFWIPAGFAHGFLTLSDKAIVQYKTTNFWNQNSERSIIWNDKDIKIDWPVDELLNAQLLISSKDMNAATLEMAEKSRELF